MQCWKNDFCRTFRKKSREWEVSFRKLPPLLSKISFSFLKSSAALAGLLFTYIRKRSSDSTKYVEAYSFQGPELCYPCLTPVWRTENSIGKKEKEGKGKGRGKREGKGKGKVKREKKGKKEKGKGRVPSTPTPPRHPPRAAHRIPLPSSHSTGLGAAPGSSSSTVLSPALHKTIFKPGLSFPPLSSMFLVSPN